jgi:hypothetical protein
LHNKKGVEKFSKMVKIPLKMSLYVLPTDANKKSLLFHLQ